MELWYIGINIPRRILTPTANSLSHIHFDTATQT